MIQRALHEAEAKPMETDVFFSFKKAIFCLPLENIVFVHQVPVLLFSVCTSAILDLLWKVP